MFRTSTAHGWRHGSVHRHLFIASFLTLGFLVRTPAVLANASGTCTVTATVSDRTVDLTSERIWHLQSSDRPTVTFRAPFEVASNGISSRSYSHSVPILEVIAHDQVGVVRRIDAAGGHPGTFANLDLSTERGLGRRFDLQLKIDGAPDPKWLKDYGVAVPSNSCEWFGTVMLDDVNPSLTILGGGALFAAIVGVLAVLLSVRVDATWWLRLLIGVIAGVSWAAALSALDQFGSGDATSPWLEVYSLFLTPVAMGLGAVLVGRRARTGQRDG